VFANYFRLSRSDTNFGGLGGRVAINAKSFLQLEGEVAYDFRQVFTEEFTDTGTGSVAVTRSDVRVLHFLFGPKIQNSGPVRVFATLKGGFINFRFDPRPATFETFFSSVEGLRAHDVHGVFYPGVGFQAYLGPIGLRFDIGDEIYFVHRGHHNLRISLGPQIRF
jgi:hypothetical protein